MIATGFRLPWDSGKPPLTTAPAQSVSRPPSNPEVAAVLTSEVQALIAKGAIEPVRDTTPGFYGRLFCVPKASGGWRPVLDLSPLNRFLQRIPFKMETIASIRESIREKDWAASIDLSDAYFHLFIHPRDRKYLRFLSDSQTYQFKALPFGLSLAPWVFTRVVRDFLLVLRQRGIRVRAFLDDWLVLADSRELCATHVAIAVQEAQALGFRLNWGKSDLIPAQQFCYLGMRFDTVTMTVKPSRERLERLDATLTRLLSRESASARDLASLQGQMESLAPLLRLGRLHKRPFQRAFRARWDQRFQSWECQIPLGEWLHDSTAQWRVLSWLTEGVPIHQPNGDVDLYTDASEIGWGAHVDSLVASGRWSAEEASLHINHLEMRAVRNALRSFQSHLRTQTVRLFTDNTTVACYVNKQGGARSIGLSQEAEKILLWCDQRAISLSARHVPGKLNILADALSRPHCILHTEWTIAQRVLQQVWNHFHRPMVDLFATRFNFRLPTYVSPVPDPQAWAVDALSLSWEGLSAYAFPPLPILPKVLRKAREEKPCLLLVAPLWPAQHWFPDLLSLARPRPLALDLRAGDLVQPRSGIRHANVEVMNLHVWHVCVDPSRH